MQKGKKSKKGFPHLGIELKTSRTEILAPIKTKQNSMWSCRDQPVFIAKQVDSSLQDQMYHLRFQPH